MNIIYHRYFALKNVDALDPLDAKKNEFLRKIGDVVLVSLIFSAATASVIHHCLPRSAFFYGYVATTVCTSIVLITALAMHYYRAWKIAEAKHFSKTVPVLDYRGFVKAKVNPLPKAENKKEIEVSSLKGEEFFNLPKDIQIEILKLFKLKDLCNLEKTCKKFLRLLDENFWKARIQCEFGESYLPEHGAKKEYGLLYSIQNNDFKRYKNVKASESGGFGTFLFCFNHKIHFQRTNALENDNGPVIERDGGGVASFEKLNEDFILMKAPQASAVYDKNYKCEVKLIYHETASAINKKDRKIFHFFENETFYFFEMESFKCIKSLRLPGLIHNSVELNDHLYVSCAEGFFVYQLSDFALIFENRSVRPYQINWSSFKGQYYLVLDNAEHKPTKLFIYSASDLSESPKEIDLSQEQDKWFLHNQLLYVVRLGLVLEIWDLSIQEPVNEVFLDNYLSRSLIFKQFLFLVFPDFISVMDLRNHEIIYSIEKKRDCSSNLSELVIRIEFYEGKLIVYSNLYVIGSANRKFDILEVFDFQKFI